MHELLVASAVFICLVAAALISFLVSDRMPERDRQDDTHTVVRLAANIFVVATSLVLGLMMTSAKNTFESVDQSVHAFATELILLDRSLKRYGPEADEVRRRLAAYVHQAAHVTWEGPNGLPGVEDRVAESLLEDLEASFAAMRPSDPVRIQLWRDVQANLQNVVRRRWSLVEESEGTIPPALLVVVTSWLAVIFASFGYRAPRNAVVITTLVAAAFLIAVAFYLILDLDQPFAGAIEVSSAPLQRAEEQISR
jgi:hypothetical protein